MKNKNLTESFRHALRGLRRTAANERNFKIHISIGLAAVVCCIILRIETALFIWVAFSIFSVLALELVNTSVEALADLFCGGKPHPLAKVAKDAAAAAVLLAAVQAVAVAAVVAATVVSRWLNS